MVLEEVFKEVIKTKQEFLKCRSDSRRHVRHASDAYHQYGNIKKIQNEIVYHYKLAIGTDRRKIHIWAQVD